MHRSEDSEKTDLLSYIERFEEACKELENKNMTTVQKVEQWVTVCNLHTQDPKVQMCKIVEELGELVWAINKGDVKGQIDGIGDTVVTLICISMQFGLKLDDYHYSLQRD